MLRVNGGPAGSGTVIKRPAREAWMCEHCRGANKGSHVRCMTAGCNEKRP